MVYYKITDELAHHGISGMKWGVRRFQNKDGSLTAAGEKRRTLRETGKSIKDTVHKYRVKYKRKKALEKARKTKEENKRKAEEEKKQAEQRMKDVMAGKIPAKKMTDTELNYRIARLNAEKQYKENELATNAGKRFVNKMWNDGVVPGMADGAKNLISSLIQTKGKEWLGIDAAAQAKKVAKAKQEIEDEKAKKEAKATKKAEKEAEKEAKKEAKAAEKEAKKAEKEQEDYNKRAAEKGEYFGPEGRYAGGGVGRKENTNVFNYPSVVNSNVPMTTAKSNTSIKRDWYDQWLDDYF